MGRKELFEQAVLPHLDAAYNLARWLTRNDQDADDVVQEACLRALRFIGGFTGGDGRPWLLAIVRHASYDWLHKKSAADLTSFDEALHGQDVAAATPESILLQAADRRLVQRALESLPLRWREVLVLRELEGLSYKEIGEILGIPIGTVMSRLARARTELHQRLSVAIEESGRGL